MIFRTLVCSTCEVSFTFFSYFAFIMQLPICQPIGFKQNFPCTMNVIPYGQEMTYNGPIVATDPVGAFYIDNMRPLNVYV